MLQSMRFVAAASVAAVAVLAQSGNEVIFVGTSVGGSADPYHLVESGTGASIGATSAFTDNCTDAVWNDTGRNVYVASSLQNRVTRGEWSPTGLPTWSTFYAAPGACYGLGLDRFRQRLWVLTGATGSTRELHCLDADPNSPGYGGLITQTTTLGTVARERWELSPSGNLAAVPHAFISGGLLEIVDTDPGSPTFTQVVVSTTVPGTSGIGFAIASDVAISIDDLHVYVLYTGIAGTTVVGGLAVLDLANMAWLDFDAGTAGQQDFTMPFPVPNVMDLALDKSFAVISGQGGGGWAIRVDFDYNNPGNTFYTEYLAGQGLLPNCNAVSLSPDWQRLAVSATPTNLSSPSNLVVIDAYTGALLQNVTLNPAWNVYTTAWQEASPLATYAQFGAGCAGTNGVPVLDAVPGSRPALGSTFQATIGNLPAANLAILTTGFSNTFNSSTSQPLPADLSGVGMPGCFQLADPVAIQFLFGSGGTAPWSWSIPSSQAWFGLPFYQQAFAIDAGANQLGLTASNGGAGVLGL
ncbi:MAG: hypothetical protein KDE27_24275 [Planctomycetes bacterium]|nr:hypothetical protein [Planctomycetota bacterium]